MSRYDSNFESISLVVKEIIIAMHVAIYIIVIFLHPHEWSKVSMLLYYDNPLPCVMLVWNLFLSDYAVGKVMVVTSTGLPSPRRSYKDQCQQHQTHCVPILCCIL